MKPSARKIYGERADRYAELDILSEERFYRPLVELARPRGGERVLDLAAGTGVLSIILSRSAASVVACDLTPEMLAHAGERIAAAGRDNISLVEADATRLPFDDDSFNLAACRLAFHHFPEPERALAEIRRVLVPGGRLVLEDVFGPEEAAAAEVRERFELLLDPSHVRSYSPSELRHLLTAAGFELDTFKRLQAEDLRLEMLLDLEKIYTPERREAVLALLREHLGRDLGGVTAREQDGGIILEWEVLLASAASP